MTKPNLLFLLTIFAFFSIAFWRNAWAQEPHPQAPICSVSVNGQGQISLTRNGQRDPQNFSSLESALHFRSILIHEGRCQNRPLYCGVRIDGDSSEALLSFDNIASNIRLGTALALETARHLQQQHYCTASPVGCSALRRGQGLWAIALDGVPAAEVYNSQNSAESTLDDYVNRGFCYRQD